MTRLEARPRHTWRELDTVPGGVRTRVSAAVVRRLLGRVADRLDLDVVASADAAVAGRPTIVLNRPAEFHARVGRDGLIGFGEAYLTGAWDSPDLAAVLTVLAGDVAGLVPMPLQRLRRWYVARRPRSQRNSVTNTRQNIADHYDLSNELFAAFLDETMTYSSALFDEPIRGTGRDQAAVPPGLVTWDELAPAQGRKIDRLLDATGVREGTRVLEIGTGWGELALRAARRGATVRTVTLSSEQAELARQRIAAAGVADRVTVELTDYRLLRGEYDAVLSVEMIEAVGYEFMPDYFAAIRSRLAPGGRAGVQAIVLPHDRMLATRDSHSFITKHIFPGGFLPSLELLDEVAAGARLGIVGRMSFGSHYAETLRLWDERFRAADLDALGFDEIFARMWHFYLSYSRAGFAARYLDVCQLVCEPAS